VTETLPGSPSLADRDIILKLAFGAMAAQTIRAAIELKVMKVVGELPRKAADVAAEVGVPDTEMIRLLRVLSSLGLLQEEMAGLFSVTSAGRLLDGGDVHSMESFVRLYTDPTILRPWDHLVESLKTGHVAFDAMYGHNFWTHLAEDPQLSTVFNDAMSQAVQRTAVAVPNAFDFGQFGSVTDVGGGDATLLAHVLTAFEELRGVVFDNAEGLSHAAETIAQRGLSDRCEVAPGDALESVPPGSDVYILKSVLHVFADDLAVTILRHCRDVLPPSGRVLIIEPVLPETVDAHTDTTAYLSDLNMLVNVGGRERTRADFEFLCSQANLTITAINPLAEAAPFSLIEAQAD